MADTAEETTTEETSPPEVTRAEAIRAALATQATELTATFDAERQTLVAHNKDKVTDVGKARERAKTAEKETESLRLQLKGQDQGYDKDEFKEAVRKEAAEIDAVRMVERKDLDEASATKLLDTQGQLETVTALEHESFVGSRFADAALGDRRPWHDGTLPMIVTALKGFIKRDVVGGVEVARLKTAEGSTVPGDGPDGMTLPEYIRLQQAGKDIPGLPSIKWYLVDQSEGAKVEEVRANGASGKKWGAMSEGERIEEWKNNRDSAMKKSSAHFNQKAAAA